jgi:biopolymer transport protein ExbB
MQGSRRVTTAVFMALAILGLGVSSGWAQDAAAGGVAEPFSIDAAIQDMKRQWEAGGMTMWFILLLSIIALAFVLERFFRLRRKAISPKGFAEKADDLWKAGNYAELEDLCKKNKKSTIAKIVGFIVTHRNASVADVTSVSSDIASRDIGHHQMIIYPLAACASLAPLLGLFGTVIGMIESFETVAIAGAMGDPSLLASGISKALVTTAWGLMVAMPTLFFYNLFRFRTSMFGKLLEEEVTALINEWMISKGATK